jgi:hypothetical protein
VAGATYALPIRVDLIAVLDPRVQRVRELIRSSLEFRLLNPRLSWMDERSENGRTHYSHLSRRRRGRPSERTRRVARMRMR